MAKTKSVDLQAQKTKFEKLVVDDNILSFSAEDFAQPDKGKINDILGQRHSQRKWLFRYSLFFSSLSFGVLIIMLYAQAVYKSHHGIELFGRLELGTVGIGVFVQFLGLLKIITDSLWNDKPYLDSGVLKNDE